MAAMAVAMGIGRFVYTPILPSMMDSVGLSSSDAGLIASSNYAGYFLGAVLASGNWGQGRERSIVLVGLVASAVLAALMGLTENVAAFLAIRFFAGVTSALVMVFSSTIVVSRLAAAQRGDLQVWHFSGVGVGIALSSLMTGSLLVAGAGWQANWLWAGGLSLAGFLVVWLLIDPGPALVGKPTAEPPMPKSPALTRTILAYGLFGFGYIITATFLVAIVRAGEAGRLFESVVWLVTGLAIIPSVWLWGFGVRRWGLPAMLAIGCTVEAVGVGASVAMGSYVGPLIGGLLLGGTFMAVTAYGFQLGRQLAQESPRRVIALMTVAFGFGQILGPIAAGFLADRTGSFTAPSLLAALVLLLSAFVVRGAGKAS
ncbi:YbfB/YjiJ family MFS transporter [Mesorhizobium sp. CAU 1741]|uniref:YbfB/YjiJ family MFS transporter n=1 Tax=Mesorhizobium sp. CAU 1741 TaxID=3140366 RepID=UPI00325AF07F